MAAGALHRRTKKDLRYIGRRLQDLLVTSITQETDIIFDAENLDLFGLFVAGQVGINQLGDHDVVWLVLLQTFEDPGLIVAAGEDTAKRIRRGTR